MEQNQQDHLSLAAERLSLQYRLPAYQLITLAVGRRELEQLILTSSSRNKLGFFTRLSPLMVGERGFEPLCLSDSF